MPAITLIVNSIHTSPVVTLLTTALLISMNVPISYEERLATFYAMQLELG
jgi:hypothetical protein